MTHLSQFLRRGHPWLKVWLWFVAMTWLTAKVVDPLFENVRQEMHTDAMGIGGVFLGVFLFAVGLLVAFWGANRGNKNFAWFLVFGTLGAWVWMFGFELIVSVLFHY